MATYTPIELPMTVASDTPTLSMTVAGNLVIGGHVPVLQTKTVYPSSSDQTIEPDTGYDALDEVDVMAVVVTNLSAANIVDGVTVKVGDANDDDSIASVTGTAQTGIVPTGTLEITSNGTENCSAYEYVDVDVANSYAVGDEGKVVHGGALVSQSSATYTQNNTYDTTMIDEVTVSVSGGGGATLGTKTVNANGTYKAEDDALDGYSQVTVSVPASAVDTGTKSITANGNNQDVVGYAAVNVNVPNSYSAGDEGKVVDNGALVAQTAHADVTPTTSDQTIDTTTNNSIKVKGDADLVAANIKKDVEIFGVTGSYEGGGGASGGLANMVDVSDSDISFAFMLSALKNGATAGGTVTYTTAFANTEQLLISTGLTTIHGFMFAVTALDTKTNTGNQNNKWFLVQFYDDETPSKYMILSFTSGNTFAGQVSRTIETKYEAAPENGTLRISGGDIYYSARYNKNANYQIVYVNQPYEWLAW